MSAGEGVVVILIGLTVLFGTVWILSIIGDGDALDGLGLILAVVKALLILAVIIAIIVGGVWGVIFGFSRNEGGAVLGGFVALLLGVGFLCEFIEHNGPWR